jgi:hypothetical protein
MIKTDIGGVQFLYPSIKDNFILKASDTMYKYIESNINGDRDQELPIVKETTVDNITNESYTYGDITDENAYKIDISWVYEEDLGYQNQATLIVVREEEQLYIIEELE